MSQVYTDAEGTKHYFPDDATPEEIDAATAAPQLNAPGSNATPSDAMSEDSRKRILADSLPTLGGTLVGMGAGYLTGNLPGAVAGAFIGGAGGEGGREAVMGQPLSAKKMAQEGGWQGAYELGGGLAVKGLAKAAPMLARAALGTVKPIAKDAIDPAEVMLAKGLNTTRKGARAANATREASSDALFSTLEQAKAAGTTFKTSDVTREVKDLLQRKAGDAGDKRIILARLRSITRQYGSRIDPVLLKELKMREQAFAKSILEGDGIPSTAQRARAQFADAFQKGAKRELEQIPGVAEREAQTQKLIKAQDAIDAAYKKAKPKLKLNEPGTYPLLKELVSTGNASRLANVLNHPTLRAFARQSPRDFAFLMSQLQYGNENPDATKAAQ